MAACSHTLRVARRLAAAAPAQSRGRRARRRHPALWLAVALAQAACSAQPPSAPVSVSASDPNVAEARASTPPAATIVGRSIDAASPAAPLGRRLSWAATQIGFRFTGTDLAVQLLQSHDAGAIQQRSDWNNHFDVIIDGVTTFDALSLTDGPASYPVARGLAPGEHTVVLRKRTESALSGSVQLLSATLDGSGQWLPPPPHKDRRIEVVGASNEAGYGVHGTDPCGGNDTLSNALAAWPTYVADALDADLHNCAISGQGVLSFTRHTLGADGQPVPGGDSEFIPMPVMWGRAHSEDPNTPWDPTRFLPQVVVFDLGGNDYDRGLATTEAQRADFIAQYAQFVSQVAGAYAQPRIYLLLNSVQDDKRRETLAPDLQAVVAAATNQGAQRVSVLALPVYRGDVWGCARHPDVQLQRQNADAIATQIASDLGW